MDTERGTEQDALTRNQVNTLPEGALITVIWTGGNGPHDYEVAVDSEGTRYAAIPGETNERMRYYNPLRFTGAMPYNTRVWLRGGGAHRG